MTTHRDRPTRPAPHTWSTVERRAALDALRQAAVTGLDAPLPGGAPLAPRARLAARRRGRLLVAALVIAATVALTRRPREVPAPPGGQLRLSAAGARPVAVLVVGPGAGLQVVRAYPRPPDGDAGADAVLPAPLASGQVALVTLGRRALRVEAAPRAGAPGAYLAGHGHAVVLRRSPGHGHVSVYF